MSTLSKEEYLKRYLDPVQSGDYKKKKKKTREKAKQTRGIKIVDDDISWSKLAPIEDDIPDELLLREEMPKVEEIDERTQEEKALDLYRKGDKWKVVDAEKDGKLMHAPSRSSARHDSDSDMDVPRRSRHDSSSESGEQTKPRRHASNQDSGSDLDVARRPRKRHDSDSMSGDGSKISVIRNKSNKGSYQSRHSKISSVKSSNRHQNRSESPNSSRTDERTYSHSMSKSKKRKQESSDSDLELPRVQRHKHSNHRRKDGPDGYNDRIYSSSSKSKTLVRRHESSDSDLELPRAHWHEDGLNRNNGKIRRRKSSDSDLDLPRKQSKQVNHRILSKKNSDLDLPRKNISHNNKKVSSGAVGGLTSRQELKRELQHKKKMESDMDSLARDSRNEATVFRVKGGKKRDLKQEKMEKDAEDKEKEKKLKKYNQWGKGVTQSELKDYALEDLIHEANKPLARYADDADLDAFQRSQMRDGDPMAAYLAKKRSKEAGNVPTMPKYRGPAPAPNRYGIPPGYRWDGVDRSNGFEKKYFNSKSESGALKQEAYKWSVEDM